MSPLPPGSPEIPHRPEPAAPDRRPRRPRPRTPARTIGRVTPTAHRRTFTALVVALLVLHVDTWNADGPPVLVLGWLPWDLAYHLLWMACATGAVVYMTSKAIWPEDQDGPGDHDGEAAP